jgi:hypothetical protein
LKKHGSVSVTMSMYERESGALNRAAAPGIDSMNKGTALLIAIMTIFLGLTFYAMVIGWNSAGEVEMSGLVIGSMVGGILLSIIIGGGLMVLLFYSSRRGYDEPVRQMRKDEE